MMETIKTKENAINKQNHGVMIQRLLRNKVYIGIKEEKLVRKSYRGKRNKLGKRKNEIFYVNDLQTFRIEESFLIKKINEILESLAELDHCNLEGWGEGKESYFEIQQKSFMRKVHATSEDYKMFISKSIDYMDEQPYKNMNLRKNIRNGNLEDIIEKIEVYETGIVCIFNNGFEMSVQF